MCDGGILIEVCLSRIDEIHRRSFLSADRGCVCDIVLEIDSSGLPSGQGVWIEAGQKVEWQRKNVSDVAFILWSVLENTAHRCLIASKSTSLADGERVRAT